MDTTNLDAALLQISQGIPDVKSVQIARKVLFLDGKPTFSWKVEIVLPAYKYGVRTHGFFTLLSDGPTLDKAVEDSIGFANSYMKG